MGWAPLWCVASIRMCARVSPEPSTFSSRPTLYHSALRIPRAYNRIFSGGASSTVLLLRSPSRPPPFPTLRNGRHGHSAKGIIPRDSFAVTAVIVLFAGREREWEGGRGRKERGRRKGEREREKESSRVFSIDRRSLRDCGYYLGGGWGVYVIARRK